MIGSRKKRSAETEARPKYPGEPGAVDGGSAVVAVETAASEAAGAYPITPSTQMGEGWAVAVARGEENVNGRRLLFFEPEGEHAAAGVTAGMSMTGLRATNFSSGQGIAYMHESLYAAAGKRLTYVLNVAARAMTKHALNVHAGHDDYHAVDDTGFFQLFAKDVQSVGDLTLIAHRAAELALNPGLVAQDGFLTSHVIESIRRPERELVKAYLGDPSDRIECPTPAQRLVFGPTRRRIPEIFDVDYPAMLGTVQNQDSYAQGVAAQRPFYFDHVAELADRAMEEYAELTGRRYARAMGYRLEDADYVLVGQGSVVPNAEAVADWLREERGMAVGVLDLVMFRPFPADLVTRLLAKKKGVTVLERVDQPLAVDPPLLREIRAAMSKGVENDRVRRARDGDGRRRHYLPRIPSAEPPCPDDLPHPGLACVAPDDVPDFYAAGFGFGSRDLQPGDLVAAAGNMTEEGAGTRHFYLGIDFVLEGTRLPKLQVWQEELLESYPGLRKLSLPRAGDLDLMPDDATSIRIHSVGGWGAITMGKNLTLTAFELLGLNVKANPKYGSEKKGQPTTFYATLSRQPIRLNCELKHVDVVLSPDPNVFRNSDPLAGLAEGGTFVIQSDAAPEEVWRAFPAAARETIRERGIRVCALDAFAIASDEASDADLRYRMQGNAFLGAFFAASGIMEREGLDEDALFEGLRDRLQRKFGSKGEQVVDDNLRVIRRGFAELSEVPVLSEEEDAAAEAAEAAVGEMPRLLDVPAAGQGIGNPGRFWEQVCSACAVGQDPIADPFAAISAMPAATSVVRDMTDIRFEVPDFVPDLCTGCSQCWVQCPDAAIPGLVNTVEEVLETAIRHAANGRPLNRIQQVSRNLAKECRKDLKAVPFTTFGDTLSRAYANLVEALGWGAERRKELDADFAAVYSALSDFPLAKTVPFFDVPERGEKGSGGLLSITINPEACKGCNICVEVCPEDALVTVKQDEEIVERLRRNWDLWEELPDTDDRYLNITDLEEGAGVLSSLLLKKKIFRTMVGGDGACMGCGEKTTVHLTISAIEALMQPRVAAFVEKLDGLIDGLEAQARELLSGDVELDPEALAAGRVPELAAELAADEEKAEALRGIGTSLATLEDLRWRYVEGPSGRGRTNLAMTNSTGCSSVWGSTYPYNPYPYPWANHLFQDAPSLGIGAFEGVMRKMSDAFVAVRRAELRLSGEYEAETHEPAFRAFDWRDFSDEEFGLCPPLLVVGGDGAMLDIGFQNLSRLLASGKPIRVMVLDTQVYSNTGGQACTSGYTGQVSDMAAYGKAQHGKEETRKELSLIAMAHRGAYVLQTSQASPSHLIEGVLKGLQSRRPAVFNVYTPCPVEHGLADEWAPHAAKLALESRAFPFLRFDPDAGDTFAECLDLSGNPSPEEPWPTYELEWVDEHGETRTEELPLTTADWAATEGRFRKHFRVVPEEEWTDEMVPFHEYVAASPEDREGKVPFIWSRDDGKGRRRLGVSEEIVTLAEDRLDHWRQLRELAGLEVPERARDGLRREVEERMAEELEARARALREEYERKMAELRAAYPPLVARRLAEGLLKTGTADATVAELLERAESVPDLEPVRLDPAALAALAGLDGSDGASGGSGGGAGAPAATAETGNGAGVVEAPPGADGAVVETAPVASSSPAATAVAEEEEEEEEGLVLEPYIETALCTSCDECTNLNNRMFKYDENKQAYIADPKAGTFKELVMAAEKCTARIIHPGTPLDRSEPDLEKWMKRAEPFN